MAVFVGESKGVPMGGGGMTGVGVEGETLSSVAVGAGMVGLGVAVVGVTSGVDPADGGVGGGVVGGAASRISSAGSPKR